MKFVIGLLIVSCQLTASEAVFAASKLGNAAQAPQKVLKISHLDAADCRTAGGKVDAEATNICPSGQACFTTDANKKVHEVCIAKSN